LFAIRHPSDSSWHDLFFWTHSPLVRTRRRPARDGA
jgi:hypothetical protein